MVLPVINNPSKVPEISNNYKKTDKEDSFQLADVFRKGGMKEIYIPDECSLGISPVYDANLSLFSNLFIVPISDTIPAAV